MIQELKWFRCDWKYGRFKLRMKVKVGRKISDWMDVPFEIVNRIEEKSWKAHDE